MDSTGMAVGERRSALVAAREAMAGLGALLAGLSGDELAELLGDVDAVVAHGVAARAEVVVEATRRGVPQECGLNPFAWVRAHAPSLRQGGAGQVARLAVQVSEAGRATGSLAPDAAREPDPESPLGVVWAAVKDGTVAPGLGMAALGEVTRLAPKLDPAMLPAVVQGLLQVGVDWGAGQMRKLRPVLLDRYGRPGELDELQERLKPVARLSMPFVQSADVTEYSLLMTPEQAAVLEAAIGPLSAPEPNEETRERDLRPAGQRRVEALTEVCRRSSAMEADGKGGAEAAAGSFATLHVSMTLRDLEERTGFGRVLVSPASGVMLSPEVVRRVACDAALVPHVLGSAGEDVDLGRVVRLFNRAQRRALARRDGGCTYPACDRPAGWSRAHHVLHWADGGETDLSNAASLCQAHHTRVHERRLWAEVRRRPDERGRYVVWDLHAGSYDRHLSEREHERCSNDPPPLAELLEMAEHVMRDPSGEADRRLLEHDLALHAEHAADADLWDLFDEANWLDEASWLDEPSWLDGPGVALTGGGAGPSPSLS